MIEKIRSTDFEDELYEVKEKLIDLEVINDYSTEEDYSQDGNSGRVDENELLTNCKITMKILLDNQPN